jgi:quercetin dioxygenase-like cupin family protein
MKYFRLYADAAGESRFEDMETSFESVDFAPPAPAVLLTEPEEAARFVFIELPLGWTGPAHPSPRKQVLFCLAGALVVTASDGSTREIAAGDAWRMEDTTGKGHTSTVIGDRDFRAAVVQLE